MTAPVLKIHLSDSDTADALHHDVRVGLSADPKWLPPKWFYDARGSELFEQITMLPEYYPTRTERELLRRSAGEIAARSAVDTLVELGSGSSEKTRLLLDALTASGSLQRFMPLDVSQSALRGAMAAVAREYPRLAVHGVVGDFTQHLELLPGGESGRRLVAFLGGTIGNLLPDERAEFFTALRAALDPGELLLLGVGLVTDPAVMVPAYNDAAGVTAEFNRNVLRVLNRELGTYFDVAAFDHVAVWDATHEWIEMRLRACRAMTVRLSAVDMTVHFAKGEEMRTEVSGKFRRDGVVVELHAAGFDLAHWWTDPDDRFALVLAAAT
ncbi:MAG TPA: L-histidine N(alpha)-methyltransferase [Pseudonocardiaceae bacterium]|jgi:L-histidine N-alpha-methyltransferase|nr:L-histidine N(alpha)-methyltransferase [Pseudonocardiaceae bacterium]